MRSRRLSKAALETLAIIAYHQPVTRAEIEEIRGVTTSGRHARHAAGNGLDPPARTPPRAGPPGHLRHHRRLSLSHFGFDSVKDLPGLGELKGAGLLDSNLPPGFTVPEPNDSPLLTPDEDPLDNDDAGEEDVRRADEEPLRDEEAGGRGPRTPLRFAPQTFNLLRQRQA